MHHHKVQLSPTKYSLTSGQHVHVQMQRTVQKEAFKYLEPKNKHRKWAVIHSTNTKWRSSDFTCTVLTVKFMKVRVGVGMRWDLGGERHFDE